MCSSDLRGPARRHAWQRTQVSNAPAGNDSQPPPRAGEPIPAVFAVEPAEYHYNPIGVVHGGVAATLLDSAMGCAVHSALPAGAGYTSLEIKVNFVRPLTAETGRVRCEAKLIHLGGRTATAEGRVVDEAGKLYAHGTTTCLIFRS